jgi:hypothetical protein
MTKKTFPTGKFGCPEVQIFALVDLIKYRIDNCNNASLLQIPHIKYKLDRIIIEIAKKLRRSLKELNDEWIEHLEKDWIGECLVDDLGAIINGGVDDISAKLIVKLKGWRNDQ